MSTSSLCSSSFVEPRYTTLITILKSIYNGVVISCSNTNDGDKDEHEITIYRAKSLECIVSLGSVAGADIFMNDALEILVQLRDEHIKGLDFSDLFTSYIIQTCARISGIISQAFEPFINYFIPPLLLRLDEKIEYEIVDEGLPGKYYY
jgi:hypothetical protein